MSDEATFDLSDVLARGFEATCTGSDGALYFWHRNFGVRIDRRSSKMSLLTDPKTLPDTLWQATRLGMKELEAAAGE